MRGKAWTKETDDILIERYANTENKILATETGYGIRTIERHAKALGLSKSREFMQIMQSRASAEGARWFEYKRLIGEKVYKRSYHGRKFEKGRIPDPEIEKKRIAAIRERAWSDRMRIMHGMLPKAKWNYDLKAYESFRKKDE